jgi:hypothetical protein
MSGERKRRAEGMGVGVTGAGWERTDKKRSLRYAGLWEGRVRVRRVRPDHRTPWKEHNRFGYPVEEAVGGYFFLPKSLFL